MPPAAAKAGGAKTQQKLSMFFKAPPKENSTPQLVEDKPACDPTEAQGPAAPSPPETKAPAPQKPAGKDVKVKAPASTAAKVKGDAAKVTTTKAPAPTASKLKVDANATASQPSGCNAPAKETSKGKLEVASKTPLTALLKSPQTSPQKAPQKSPHKTPAPGATLASRKSPLPTALPLAEPILFFLSPHAKAASLMAWQFARAFAGPLGLKFQPTLQGLEAALMPGASVSACVDGVLGNLHVSLLRVLLNLEDDPLALAAHGGVDGEDDTAAIAVSDNITPMDTSGEGKGAGSTTVNDTATMATALVTRLRDALPLISAVSWPEVLRHLVAYWAKAEKEPVDKALVQLADWLATHEYNDAPADTKVLALEQLCHRALEVFRHEVKGAADEGQAADASRIAAERAAKRAINEAGKQAKEKVSASACAHTGPGSACRLHLANCQLPTVPIAGERFSAACTRSNGAARGGHQDSAATCA